MSQASKHVEWCLNKAKKEIEECRKLNKKGKHRGLLVVGYDEELAKSHIAKAEHNVKAAQHLIAGNYFDTSMGAIFYSMYHCFLAIASKFGYESSNQSCTISLMEFLKEREKINIDSKFIELFKYGDEINSFEESVIQMREDLTYGVKTNADQNKINELLRMCRTLIDQTKDVVYEVNRK